MARSVKFKFNPFVLLGVDPPKGVANRQQSLKDMSDFLLEQVLQDVGKAFSPVLDAPFDPLSKSYSKFKRSKGRGGRANLEFKGDLLNALKTKVQGNQITLITEGKQAGKADGHNNHSGRSLLPERRYIPKPRESFREGILDGMRRIVEALD